MRNFKIGKKDFAKYFVKKVFKKNLKLLQARRLNTYKSNPHFRDLRGRTLQLECKLDVEATLSLAEAVAY